MYLLIINIPKIHLHTSLMHTHFHFIKLLVHLQEWKKLKKKKQLELDACDVNDIQPKLFMSYSLIHLISIIWNKFTLALHVTEYKNESLPFIYVISWCSCRKNLRIFVHAIAIHLLLCIMFNAIFEIMLLTKRMSSCNITLEFAE